MHLASTHHAATVGKNGVSINCTTQNHKPPNVKPTTAPQHTWLIVWYNKYILQYKNMG